MKQYRLTVTVGCITFSYWIGFYAFVFQDWYLCWPSVGLLLKVVMPIAVLVNVGALIVAMGVSPSKRKLWKVAAIALHGIPMVAGVVFLWWLFSDARI